MDSVTVPRGVNLEGLFGDEKVVEDPSDPDAPTPAPATHCLKFHFNHGKYSNYWISEAMTEPEAQEMLSTIRTGSYSRLYKVNDTLVNIPQTTYIEIIEATT